MIDLRREFLIFELSYALKFFKRQKRLFFSNDVENLDKEMTTISETKEREYDESVEFKINIDNMTTQSRKTQDNKVLIQFDDIKKKSFDVIFESHDDFCDMNNIVNECKLMIEFAKTTRIN